MSITTLRPTSTTANGTSTPSAGTRHGCVSDDSDTTYVDLTSTYAAATGFGFDDPSLPAGAQVASAILRVRAKTPDVFAVGVGGLIASGSTYVGSQSIVVGSGETNTTLAAGYTNLDEDFSVGIWRYSASGTVRLYEVYLDIYHVNLPEVTVTAPTGTLTDTNRPLVVYSVEFDELSPGSASADYEIRVVNDGVYGGGGDPGAMTAEWSATRIQYPNIDFTSGSVRVGTRLPNDTYRAYVRVQDAVSGWSDWEYAEFTVNVTPPDAPAIVVTNEASDLRVKIAVTPDNSPVTTDGVRVERSIDGGDWEVVDTHLGSSAVDLYDYFLVSGQEVDYRVSGWNDTDDGELVSAYSTASITPSLPWRIIYDASLHFAIDNRPSSWLRSVPSISSTARQSINQPLGSTEAVVVSDTRGTDVGQITVLCKGLAVLEELREVLDGGSRFWLASDGESDFRDRWVAFGDIEENRLIDNKVGDVFDVTLPWTEVS